MALRILYVVCAVCGGSKSMQQRRGSGYELTVCTSCDGTGVYPPLREYERGVAEAETRMRGRVQQLESVLDKLVSVEDLRNQSDDPDAREEYEETAPQAFDEARRLLYKSRPHLLPNRDDDPPHMEDPTEGQGAVQ